jgi:AraC family transcriptional regulator of adaptative response / DNA-3-methyladenine glycosylase II
MLLVSTDLPAADVAFSAGFASVRQFNDTVREVFGLSPSDLRARRPAAARTVSAPAAGTIDLVLPHRAPFDAAGLFAWMRARAVAGVEEAGDVLRPRPASARGSGLVRDPARRRGEAAADAPS